MHKKLIGEEEEKLSRELKDLDYMKTHNPKGYEEGEHYLDGQDKTITKVSNTIHRLRER